MKIFSWRHAVQRSDLGSTTKLVLLNLSLYMNEVGQGCYPSVERQVEDTGLSKKSVITHLDKAVEAGFIIKKKHGYSGQGWARNEYEASFPENKTGENDEKRGEPVTPPSQKGGEPRSKGGVSDNQKVVKEVHTNSSINSTYNTPENARDENFVDWFEKFWQAYPKKTGIGKARGSWNTEMMVGGADAAGADPEQIVNAAMAYARKHRNSEVRYLQKPCNFLSDRTYLDPDLQAQSPHSRPPIEFDQEWIGLISKEVGSVPASQTFGGCALSVTGNTATIAAPTKFTADNIRNRYEPTYSRVIKALYPQVEFITITAGV